MQVETVKIVRKDHPEGYVVINKSDMKEGDKLYTPEVVKPTTTKRRG